MKAKNISKRVLSVILCTVMLFSCWVFTAPTQANAATHTYSQQKYKVRVLAVATNDYDCNTGTVTIYYRNENGTASSDTGTKSYDFGNSIGNCTKIFSGGGANYGYWPSTDGVEVEGFPYKAYAHHSKTSNGLFWNTDGSFDLYIQIYKANGWNDYGGTATNNGSIDGKYKKGIAVSSASISGKGDFGTTTTIANADYPKITSGNMSTAMASSSITCPATSSSASSTNSFSNFSAPKDQYGVNMKYTITATGSVQSTAISVDASKVSVGFSANIAGTTNSQTVTVASSCPVKVSNSNSSSSNTFTLNDASYSVKFYNASNTEISGSAKTVRYGSDAAAPASPSKSWDADLVNGYHYQFKTWKTSSISADANKNVTENRDCYPDWNTTKHSWGSWSKYTGTSDGNDASAYHRSLCNVNSQSHYKYEAHKGAAWGTWAQGDADNHTQTCGTCGYVLTQAHTFTSKTVKAAALKSAATCTEDAVYYKSCSVCGRVSTSDSDIFTDTGSALGHDWTDKEYEGVNSLKTREDCLNNAVYYKVCSRCHLIHETDTWIKLNTALGHSWNPTTFTFSEAGTTATATRVCKRNSDHTETLPASMSHAQKTAPTCTEKGWTTYTATSPFSGESNVKDTKDVQDIPATGHAYGDWTDYDNATQHMRVCANDANHKEYANHSWSGWQNVAPMADETGVRATVRQKLADAQYNEETSHYNYCTVCGYTKIESHPPVEQWTIDQEHTYPATCEAAGQTTSECPDCHKTKVTPIDAKGHKWVRWEGCDESQISELNSSVPVIFKCQNGCGQYCAGQYDSETEQYVQDPSHTGTSPTSAEIVSYSDSIPTPMFNEYEEPFDPQNPYVYAERKASLRVRLSEQGDPTQAMRFSGHLKATNLLGKVNFNADPNLLFNGSALKSLEEIRANKDAYFDNTIIDFGFVFTQARFIRTAKTVIDYDLMTLDNIGTDYRIYRMSVVGNNLDNYNQGKSMDNWKGLTMLNYDEDLTFNLVIDVNEKNYQATYCARTYIIYKYRGDIIVLYDQPGINYEDETHPYYSHDSVYNQAEKNLALDPQPPARVITYLENKIINNTATQNFNDSKGDKKVDYTLKNPPKLDY